MKERKKENLWRLASIRAKVTTDEMKKQERDRDAQDNNREKERNREREREKEKDRCRNTCKE